MLAFLGHVTGSHGSKYIIDLVRPFARNVKRCDEILLKIDNIIKQLDQFNKPVIKAEVYDRAFSAIETGMKKNQIQGNYIISGHAFIENIESEVETDFMKINDQINNYEIIVRDHK